MKLPHPRQLLRTWMETMILQITLNLWGRLKAACAFALEAGGRDHFTP